MLAHSTQQGELVRLRIVKGLAVPICTWFLLYTSCVQAGTIYSGFADVLLTDVAPPGGRPANLAGGTFDLHAGAQVIGALPTNTQVTAIPKQPAALNVFPTKASAAAWKAIGRQQNHIIIGGGAVINPPPGGTAIAPGYTTAPKDFTRGIAFTTPTAFRRATNPANGFQTSAEAVASITFAGNPAAGTATVNPVGSYASLQRGGSLKLGYGPNGKAGSLVRDPLDFTNIGPGAMETSTFSLKQSDFRVQVDDPEGVASMIMQLGTDAFGSTHGPLGLDSYGEPLLLQMRMIFLPDGIAGLSFVYDSSLSNQQFFDPENANQTITGNVEDFLASRLEQVLQFNSTSNTWTLSRNVSLFGEKFSVPSGETSLSLDYMTAQQVSAAPEPASLTLLGIGTVGLVGYGWRRRKRAA